MNSELFKRLRTAGKYQKKAIQALFPESVNHHFAVIEQECKAIFVEAIADCIKQYKETEPSEESHAAKKVDIM